MIEIAAVCDRATVLREGETVGVVDVTAGSEDRIVELMLGQAVEAMARRRARGPGRTGRASRPGSGPRPPPRDAPRGRDVRAPPGRGAGRRGARGPGPGRAVRHPRRRRPAGRRRAADRRHAVVFRHPADAIRAGRRVRRRRPRRGAPDAAVGAREHRPAVLGQGLDLGADQPRHASEAGCRARSSGCRSTPGRRARCGGCRAATSRR